MREKGLEPGDMELIAAFLDRRLPEPERRELMERLDRDEALYEVFVETVRYREGGSGEGARVIDHPDAGRGRWVVPSSIAALLVLALALPLVLRDGGRLAGAGLAQALVEDGRLQPSLQPGWIEQGWSRTRGGLTELDSELDSAFRVGVQAVDLEVALRLGRTDEARQLLGRIDNTLAGIDLSDQLRISYTEIQRQLEAGVPLEQALELAASADSHSSDLLDLGYGYAFGKWAEAGKLAAWSGNEELLRSRPFRKMLEEIRTREWSDAVEERLAAIASMIEDRQTELDTQALAEAFTAVINAS